MWSIDPSLVARWPQGGAVWIWESCLPLYMNWKGQLDLFRGGHKLGTKIRNHKTNTF